MTLSNKRPSLEALTLDFLERRKGQAFAIFEIEPTFLGQKVFCTQITIKRRLNYLVAKGEILVRQRKDTNYNEWYSPVSTRQLEMAI